MAAVLPRPFALALIVALAALGLGTGCGDSGPCTVLETLVDPFTEDVDDTGVVILENTSRDDHIVAVAIFDDGSANDGSTNQDGQDSHPLDLAPGEQETFRRVAGYYDLIVFWADADPSYHVARVRSDECLTVHAGGG